MLTTAVNRLRTDYINLLHQHNQRGMRHMRHVQRLVASPTGTGCTYQAVQQIRLGRPRIVYDQNLARCQKGKGCKDHQWC